MVCGRAFILLQLALMLLVLSTGPTALAQGFTHELEDGHLPWTDKPFDDPPGRFRFAIHSDLTGGERPGVFAVAVAQLNLLRPEFIINVGDLIAGTDDRSEIERHWDRFAERAARARAPLFHVGGNHDLLGVALREAWEERHGPRYYHFLYKNTLFLVLDSEDHDPDRLREIARMRAEAFAVAEQKGWDAFAEMPYALIPENAGGAISPRQADYFVDVLERHGDVRWTFVFTHKAPWLRADHAPFQAIEAALAGRNYTLFHGHKHAYQHQQRQDADYIQLATTGGVFLPENGRSMDQLVLVTVDDEGIDIANLLMEGILDRHGNIPEQGGSLCLDSARCP
jgi:hypothetical protein